MDLTHDSAGPGPHGAPAADAGMTPDRRKEALGAILRRTGKVQVRDIEAIAKHQRANNLRFGEAAVSLGLVKPADVVVALAHQFSYPLLDVGDQRVDPEVAVAFSPSGSTVEAVRILRNQILVRWLDKAGDNRSLSILSAENGTGRTFIAANLAAAYAQLGRRVLLVDAHVQSPRVHRLFRLENDEGLTTIFRGRTGIHGIAAVDALPGLFVLPSGPRPPSANDLLSREAMGHLLMALSRSFDLVIVDTPADNSGGAARMIASRAGTSLLLVRANRTSRTAVVKLADQLQQLGASVVGVALNHA